MIIILVISINTQNILQVTSYDKYVSLNWEIKRINDEYNIYKIIKFISHKK